MKIAQGRLPGAIASRTRRSRTSCGQAMLERLKQRGAVARNPVSSEYLQMAMDTGLIHGESVLLIDLSTCTRCDECVRGCADAHGGEPSFIREGERYRNWLIPTACYQCTDPVCMMDCPTGAITREVGTLEVTINEPHLHRLLQLRRALPLGQHRDGRDRGEAARRQAVELASQVRPVPGPARGARLRADVPARLRGRASPSRTWSASPRPCADAMRLARQALRPKDPAQPRGHRRGGRWSCPRRLWRSRPGSGPGAPSAGLGLAFGILAALALRLRDALPGAAPAGAAASARPRPGSRPTSTWARWPCWRC